MTGSGTCLKLCLRFGTRSGRPTANTSTSPATAKGVWGFGASPSTSGRATSWGRSAGADPGDLQSAPRALARREAPDLRPGEFRPRWSLAQRRPPEYITHFDGKILLVDSQTLRQQPVHDHLPYVITKFTLSPDERRLYYTLEDTEAEACPARRPLNLACSS